MFHFEDVWENKNDYIAKTQIHPKRCHSLKDQKKICVFLMFSNFSPNCFGRPPHFFTHQPIFLYLKTCAQKFSEQNHCHQLILTLISLLKRSFLFWHTAREMKIKDILLCLSFDLHRILLLCNSLPTLTHRVVVRMKRDKIHKIIYQVSTLGVQQNYSILLRDLSRKPKWSIFCSLIVICHYVAKFLIDIITCKIQSQFNYLDSNDLFFCQSIPFPGLRVPASLNCGSFNILCFSIMPHYCTDFSSLKY